MYIDASTKSCDFWDALLLYFNSNGYTGFLSDKNSIKGCVYKNNTPTANGNCTIPYLNHFNTTNLNSTQRAVFLNWPIRTVYIETDISLILGTIAGFICYFGGPCSWKEDWNWRFPHPRGSLMPTCARFQTFWFYLNFSFVVGRTGVASNNFFTF